MKFLDFIDIDYECIRHCISAYARPTSRRSHRSRMPRQLCSRCSRLCNRLCRCNPWKHKLHKLRHSHKLSRQHFILKSVLQRRQGSSAALFSSFWHCGGYLSLRIFALCRCRNACNSSCRWLALASSFKELLGTLLSKKITKRLGLIEN